MARPSRTAPPGTPLHIVHRGNNRQDVFKSAADRAAYLAALHEFAERYDVGVHAYVLMTNHVHLLVTPGAPNAVSRMMQQVGRQYVRYFNRLYGRSGTLWEGRFRSSVIRDDSYLLACYRYIEMNPVRAGLSARPEQFRWSSYRANTGSASSQLVRPHASWLALGRTNAERYSGYKRLFAEDNRDQARTIRRAIQTGADVIVGSE